MSQQDQPRDSGMMPIIVLGGVLLTMAAYGIWKFKHSSISFYFLKWKYYEILPFTYLFDFANQIKMGFVQAAAQSHLMTAGALMKAGAYSGMFYVPFVAALAALFSYRALNSPYHRAKRVFDAASLVRAMSAFNSAVVPVMNRDLSNDKSSEWMPSLAPEDFVTQNNLVKDGKLDVERTREIFLEIHLGRKVRKLDQLKSHEKALFAVFASRIWGKRGDAEALLDQLNLSSGNSKHRPDFRVAQEAYNKYRTHKDAIQILKAHPYVKTFLMELLQRSRKTGKLATSKFIWLKPNDRLLYYALNTVGRRVPFIESAAAFNQWQAERTAADYKLELLHPYVEKSISGLERYLKEIGIVTGD